MYGAALPAIVKQLFARIDLNQLENMLLQKYVTTDHEHMPENIVNLARKVLESKKDLPKRAKKDLDKCIALFEKHEFWSTQPVQTVYDLVEADDFNKPVETKTVAEVREEPLTLPPGFVWSEIDLQKDEEALELYKLLKNHYVEDSNGEFRFDYSIPFLKWALNPPGYFPEWIIGVRDTAKGNLYACITGIPVHMTV
jgi:hypothetical protein